MDAEVDAVAFALLVAVTLAVVALVADAVNVAEVVVVADSAPPPLTVHATPAPVVSFARLALKTCACPESIVTPAGETDTVIGCCCVPEEDEPPLQAVKAMVATATRSHPALLLAAPVVSAENVESFIGQASWASHRSTSVQSPSICYSGIPFKTPSCLCKVFPRLRIPSPG